MGLAAATMLAAVSLALTVEVPAQGGTYTEGLVGSPRFINPLLAISDTDRDLTALVYSGLLKTNPDGSLSSDLARSYSISPDMRTYTFTLADNAVFHDGQPVTAEDVAFTVRAAEDPNIKSPRRADWEGVDVEVIDAKTISFTLKTPYAPFLQNMTLGILPKHLWQNVTPEEFSFSTLNADPVGSGPYEMESLKRNKSGIPTEYRLRAANRGTRIPYIQNFVFKIYSNADEVKAALNQGEVKAAYGVATNKIIAPHTVVEAVFDRIFGVFFNQSQNQLFAEKAVRQALNTAIDKKTLVSTVLGGHGSVIEGPLPPTSVDSAPQSGLSAAERIAEAKSILAAAGWKAGDDGILVKTITAGKKKSSERLSFSLSTSNVPELKQAAEIVAENWKAVGAEVELKLFDQNDLNVSVIRPRQYDALLFGLVVGKDLDLFAFWHSSQRNDPGLNIALYANVDTDKKLEALRTIADPAKRLEKAREVAKDITNDTAAVFLYTPYFAYVTPQNLSGIHLGTIATPSDRYAGVEEWYLQSERVWGIFK
jgi:peptide/nickel transport system substrate-binding protein